MIKKLKIKNIDIELKKDFSVFQDVDLVFNSASGLLLMRTGTAKAIRDYSEALNQKEMVIYNNILNSFSNPIIQKYIKTFNVSSWEPKSAQLSSFNKIIENNGPFNTGDIILDKDWSKLHSKDILHLVGMTYHLHDGELLVDKVTESSLTNIIRKALKFSDENKYGSIAIPVLCTRGDYGLNPNISLRAILTAIKETELKFIKTVIICFESEGPREVFDTLNISKLF